jgi:hypothetical protein
LYRTSKDSKENDGIASLSSFSLFSLSELGFFLCVIFCDVVGDARTKDTVTGTREMVVGILEQRLESLLASAAGVASVLHAGFL